MSDDITLLTAKEVAPLLRVSKMTVYRMIKTEELPAVQVGRLFRIPRQAVEAKLRRELTPEEIKALNRTDDS